MAYPLISLALDYHRDPLVFRHLSEVRRPLPEGFEDLFAEFCTALAPAQMAETAEQYAIEPEELEEAARFLVRHVLLHPEADHYRSLGLNRGAGPEAIRRHYQWLIRMFHPDRVDTANEVWAFQATRLNQAYHTLRDVQRRQAYDADLPPYEARETPPAWFFQAQHPLVKLDRSRPVLEVRPRTRGSLAGLLGFALAGGSLVALLSMMNSEPELRLAPTEVRETHEAFPGYLVHDAPVRTNGPVPTPPEPPVVDESETILEIEEEVAVVGPVVPPVPVSLSREARNELIALMTGAAPPLAPPPPPKPEPAPEPQPEPAPKPKPIPKPEPKPTPKPETPPTPQVSVKIASAEPTPAIEPKPVAEPVRQASSTNVERAARLVIEQMQSAYRNRDASAFAALFTRTAQVNEGQGRSLIRSKYADLFQSTTETRLYIDPIDWRRHSNGRLTGSGSFSVSAKYQGSNVWQYARGRMDFVLVPDAGRYRISSMIYRIQ